MKKNNITTITILIFVAILVLCGYFQRIYLKRTLLRNQAVVYEGIVSAGDENSTSALRRKIELLESKNKVLQELANEKNRRIEQLEERLYKVDAILDASEESDLKYAGSGSGSRSNISFKNSTRTEMANRLKILVEDICQYMDEEQAAAFRKEFGAFIEDLSADKSNIPLAQRKKNLLAKFQEELEGSESEYQKKMLQQRIDAINNASEQDVPGILAYFQKLEDIQTLGQLMSDFNIGRDELLEVGVNPPPRSEAGPDPLELAVNMDSFLEAYVSLVPQDKQAQFTERISGCLEELTKWRNDAEVEQHRAAWYDATRASYEKRYNALVVNTSLDEKTKEEKLNWTVQYYKGLLERAEKASGSRIRQIMQSQQMSELRNLLIEYKIPSSDLRQYGVMMYGW